MKRKYNLRLLVNTNSIVKEKMVLITGFQGFGTVGYLTTRYLVSKLAMSLIGYIEPPYIPDFTSVEEYGLSMPHEVFFKDLNNLGITVLLNRINPDRRYLTSFVKAFTKLLKSLKIECVYLVGGLDIRFREGNEEFRWLKTKASNVTLDKPYFIKGAYIVGPIASLLIELEKNNIPAIAIFPYTEPESVDHRATAIAIKALNSLLDISVDVEELIKYAEKIEELERSVQEMLLGLEKKESVMHT
ncbi:PAC2 family protein [Ignisphaera sp. 4213-co]|uniref:PAC2 family protein n=1 Tax=Ignisphaera cupida TaxID=3050454 RepID=A0ABD4Z4C3_9CREN|nr:PAC2 family protein [Ignisphaera sp. 4213-co]MDK6027763.1 PAC2 family protein [Ignisphaera sp. 4213-co]